MQAEHLYKNRSTKEKDDSIMGASTEKKNRSAAMAAGTHKKTLAAQKEAEKQRKDKIKWTVVGIVIALFLGAIIYLNTGAFYRSASAVTVDLAAYEKDGVSVAACSDDYSIAEVNYVFRYTYSNFINTYGSMASYLGLDTSSSLKSQSCSIGGSENEDYTWFDYFMDSAKSQLRNYTACAAYAKAVGIELSEDDLAEIDSAVESLTASAEENGYSLNGYLTAYYGKGCNESVFRHLLQLEYITMAVQTTIENTNEYTADDITAHYAEIADDYDYYSYSYYFVAAETTTDEDGNTAAPTDEALAAAKASAEQILDVVKNGDEEAAAEAGDLESAVIAVLGEEVVPEPTENEDGTTTENTASTTAADVQGQSVPTDLAEWLKSADRQAGDMDVVEVAESGYYVVIFTERYTQTEATEESGDVPYCDYISEHLLRDADFDEWNTNFYTDLYAGAEAVENFAFRYVK